MIERFQRPIVAFALGFFLIVSITSMSHKAPTKDEPTYVAAGYSYLVTGAYQLNREHPPLIKMIAASPLLLLGLDYKQEDPSWKRDLAMNFVFRNRLSPDTIIFWARLPVVLMSLALGWFLFWWSRSLGGPLAGLLALGLYVLDPNIIAHSQLVTLDLGLTVFFTLAVYSLLRYLRAPSRPNLWAAGVGCALAILAKFSGFLLVPIYATVSLVRHLSSGNGSIWSHVWRLFAVAALMTIVVAFVVYRFELGTAEGTSNPIASLLASHTSSSSPVRTLVLRIGSALPVPSFWWGLILQARHDVEGHPYYAYLKGQLYLGGRWDYFPVAFAVKTPIGTLGLLFVALATFAYRLFVRRDKTDLSLEEWGILVASVVFFALSMLHRVNIGVRYILPIYPLVFIFIASQLVWLWSKAARARVLVVSGVVVLLTFVAFSSLRTYPDYLAYFNEFAGGPENGWRYLIDSNLDWGQDLLGLRTYLKSHAIDDVYLSYFGYSPDSYGIRWKPVPSAEEVARAGIPRSVVAISVSSLMLDPPRYNWLWAFRPTATIGHSIWVFDLRP